MISAAICGSWLHKSASDSAAYSRLAVPLADQREIEAQAQYEPLGFVFQRAKEQDIVVQAFQKPVIGRELIIVGFDLGAAVVFVDSGEAAVDAAVGLLVEQIAKAGGQPHRGIRLPVSDDGIERDAKGLIVID